MINTKDLNLVLQEAAALTSKKNWTKQDEKRFAYLQTAAAAIRSGVSLAEIDQEQHNEHAIRNGLKPVNLTRTSHALTAEQESEARAWKHFVETRAGETQGNLLTAIGTYSALGYFVPTGFMQKLYTAMAAHDFLFNEDDVTLIKTTTGAPMSIPVAGDIENVASVSGENPGTISAVNISAPGQVTLGAYSYQTPLFIASLEVMQDLNASFGAVQLFQRFSDDRLSRGISKDLLLGDGQNVPLGLIPTLETLGISPTIAQGSSGNDGGAGTGANSLGSVDFVNLLASIDQAYLASDKFAFVMNLKTLATLSGQVDKYGNLLRLVRYESGYPTIFGFPVKTSPSMPNIGASNVSVLAGDFSYWLTRITQDDTSGIQVFNEAPGLVENGNFGLKTFIRAHGVLAFSDTVSPCPIRYIQHHS